MTRMRMMVVATVIALGAVGSVQSSQAATPTPPVRIDAANLRMGAPPRVDVVVGKTLYHAGKSITMRLRRGYTDPGAMGSSKGIPIISAAGSQGSQFFTVAANGATKRLGRTFDSYSTLARFVPNSGHLMIIASDRGSDEVTVTILSAATGRQLTVVRNAQRRTTNLSKLAAADRAIIQVINGTRKSPANRLAVCPDRRQEVVSKNYYSGSTTSFVVRQIGTKGGKWLLFTRSTDQPVFETNRTVLFSASISSTKSVIVRCTLAGTCVRATPAAAYPSIAWATATQVW